MLKNYLLTTLRYIHRGPLFSIINIVGLVAGITASTLLFMFVWDELRYDSFHTNKDSIYRVTVSQNAGPENVVTPGPLGPQLVSDHAAIKDMVRVGKWSGTLRHKNFVFEEDRINFADKSLFDIFDFQLIKGDKDKILTSPKEIVLTESSASRYFGKNWRDKSDLLGSVLSLNKAEDFFVSGVVQDPPGHSSIKFDFLISFKYIANDKWSYNWGSHNFHTYLLLERGANASVLSEEIRGDLAKQSPGFSLSLQSLNSIYLSQAGGYDWTEHGEKQYVVIFALVGFVILVVACFNYINLSTARARKRSREVGIRKVIGAHRSQLVVQFLGESFLIVTSAALISRGLIDLLLPYFNLLSGKHLSSADFQGQLLMLIGAMIILTSLLSGVYPALLLSSFRPLNVLNMHGNAPSGQRFRSILVTTQFMISTVLISGALFIYDQFAYMRSKDIGFDHEQLAYVKLGGTMVGKAEAFKRELLNSGLLQKASITTSELVDTDNGSYIEWPGKVNGQEISISQINIDEDFISLLDVQLAKGRNFVATDSGTYILNETAVKAMGLSNDKALGMRVKFWGTEGTIVGITKDFHFRPLYHPITPLIIRHAPRENYYRLVFKANKSTIHKFNQEAQKIYLKYENDYPFQVSFVDEMINSKYRKDTTAGALILYFSGLSVLIATLGLFGLIAYTIERRTKEFSIRKILGANVFDIFRILSRQFLFLFSVALALAIPITLSACNAWLSNFAYRAPLNVANFLITAVVVLTCSLLMFSFQSMAASLKNPASVLKESD